jgi:TolA-binding protein
MDDQKITVEELKTLWAKDVDALAKKVADAINAATPGAIIDESEEPVRDANAEFRCKAYQQALGLLQDKNLQEAFSPSADSIRDQMG